MNTAVINVKIDPTLKQEAQGLAEEFGLSLSGIITGFLKQMVRTRQVQFQVKEEPTAYMIKELEASKKDTAAGRVSPGFTNAKDAIAWLRNPKARYAGKL